MRSPGPSHRFRRPYWVAASLSLALASCSLLNRVGPDVTCADLDGGAISACEHSIIARCVDGQTVTFEVCDDGLIPGEDVCKASWQDSSNHRCKESDTAPNLGCGNGTVSGSEACDDGNVVDDDGCDSNCTPTACGNGVNAGSEACDDGNVLDDDGCDSNCTPTGCGNGVKAGSEACDDGNLTDGDGCDSNCTVTACGNGIKTGTEACDDGESNADLGLCTKACIENKVLKVAAGSDHTCALVTGGKVRCWGEASSGELGYGNTTDLTIKSYAAGFVSLGEPAKDLVAGAKFSCALLESGNVRCWGRGSNGQLGYGNTLNIGDDETPDTVSPVSLGATVAELSTSRNASYTCARLTTGVVRCWGANGSGQLGYGHTNTIGDNELPSSVNPVSLGAAATQVSSSGDFGHSHSCAVLATGALRCWGSSIHGALGLGSTGAIGDNELPSSVGPVSLMANAKVVATGSGYNNHTCVLLTTGGVQCWGWGGPGALGYGNTTSLSVPGGLVSLTGAMKSLVADQDRSCALLTDGTIQCWGAGSFGYGTQGSIGDNELPSSVGTIPLNTTATGLWDTFGYQVAGRHAKAFVSASSTQFAAYGPYLEVLQYPAAVLTASATKLAAEQEDNATMASATALYDAKVDLGWGGKITPVADQDYFKITVAAGKSLRLRTTTRFDGTTCPGNTLIRLYDPNGNALGFDDDDGLGGGCSLIDPNVDAFASNLAAGTYYIRVEEQGNDAIIDPYQLLVEAL